MGRPRCGGGSWGGGGRRSWGSVSLYFLPFHCRTGLQIGGSGSLTLTEATLSGSISAFGFSGLGFHGWRGKTHLAPSGSAEGLHLCVMSIAWQVVHKSQPGHSRHLIYYNSFVRFWSWRDGVNSSFIYLLWYFWFSLVTSAFVDWHPGGGVHLFKWSLCPVYIFSRWFSGTSLLFAAHLACLYFGYVDGEKSQVVPTLGKHYSSVVGQDQTLFF
jgi:hypothetical protein